MPSIEVELCATWNNLCFGMAITLFPLSRCFLLSGSMCGLKAPLQEYCLKVQMGYDLRGGKRRKETLRERERVSGNGSKDEMRGLDKNKQNEGESRKKWKKRKRFGETGCCRGWHCSLRNSSKRSDGAEARALGFLVDLELGILFFGQQSSESLCSGRRVIFKLCFYMLVSRL